MRWNPLMRWGAVTGLLFATLGAAPAPTTYIGIEQQIARIRETWSQPDATPQPNAQSWNTFFDALLAELQVYRAAPTHGDKLRSLARLTRMYNALNGVNWGPSRQIAAELEAWLRPRNALTWADRGLFQSAAQLPSSEQWKTFGLNLREANARFEAAPSVRDRLEAHRRLSGGLDSLRQVMTARPSSIATQYEAALRDLIEHPNLDATVDFQTLSPLLDQTLVQPEVLFFKGQTSYITPGPKAGYGLLSSDQGIAFYAQQYSYATTPIQGFQEQIASDRRGRRAANLYQFSATTYNTTLATVQILITPQGVFITPGTQSNVEAAFASAEKPGFGRELTRGIAGLIGFDQERILSELQNQAMPEIRAQTAQGSLELSQIRAGQNQAQLNAQISNYLVGNNTLAFQNYAVRRLDLRSRPQYIQASGLVEWRAPIAQVGAPFPQPRTLKDIPGGITLDVHLGSVLGNLAAGAIQSPQAQLIERVLLVIEPSEDPNAPPKVEINQNANYATFLQAVKNTRAKGPGHAAIRAFKPGKPPRFSADAQGRLVVALDDITVEVPAPEAATRGALVGPPAQAYRIEMPTAEVVLSFQVVTEPVSGQARVEGKIEQFAFDPASRVFALGEEEDTAQELSLLARSGVLGGLTAQFINRPINVPVATDRLSGIQLDSVSPLDPTGWIRAQFRTTGAPISLALRPESN